MKKSAKRESEPTDLLWEFTFDPEKVNFKYMLRNKFCFESLCLKMERYFNRAVWLARKNLVRSQHRVDRTCFHSFQNYKIFSLLTEMLRDDFL